MTKIEMFNLIAEVNADNEEIVEFCKKEIEILNKRKSSKTPTKTQRENEEVISAIADILNGFEEGATASEILKEVVKYDERFSEFSIQKISALLRKMKEAGTVEKTAKGKKTIFTLV